ncbi:amidohydrolase family protein [Phycicoccus elongatus]|uniref:amidohydrolase n=1 Tax=Phycicoccus elongatus TaxID=101689 RepID=UPI003783D050
MLLRSVRLVPIGLGGRGGDPVDLRIVDGQVTQIAPTLGRRSAEQVIDAEGRWAIPGLWDQHTHPAMWALTRRRIDLVGATGPDDTLRRVAEHMRGIPAGTSLVLGYGHRSGDWTAQPSVAALDAVTGDRPVALASGDGHNGWLNSAALRLIGLPPRSGILAEEEWYAAYTRLEVHDPDSADPTEALRDALGRAHAKGVVGIRDFEFGSSFDTWPTRVASGLDTMRVRASVYPDRLEEVGALGLRTGDPLVPGQPLVTMGPLKIISDGSLNTLTAWCCEPYLGEDLLDTSSGAPNLDLEELVPIMARARALGVTAAIHAIGDAAVAATLDAFEASGQIGTMEHAQLVRWSDLPRMARLRVNASVQPAHVLDDRDVSQRWWGDRTERLYAFRAMVDAGIALMLGSDAPVSPLDPWLAMAAAVHRSGDQRSPWHQEQAITVAEALSASIDGQPTLGVGSRGDIALLDADPLAVPAEGEGSPAHAAYLRGMQVAATIVAGRVVHTSSLRAL